MVFSLKFRQITINENKVYMNWLSKIYQAILLNSTTFLNKTCFTKVSQH